MVPSHEDRRLAERSPHRRGCVSGGKPAPIRVTIMTCGSTSPVFHAQEGPGLRWTNTGTRDAVGSASGHMFAGEGGTKKNGKSRNTNWDDTALFDLSSCVTHPPQSLSPTPNPLQKRARPPIFCVDCCLSEIAKQIRAATKLVSDGGKGWGGGYSVTCHVRVLETMPNRGLRGFHSPTVDASTIVEPAR